MQSDGCGKRTGEWIEQLRGVLGAESRPILARCAVTLTWDEHGTGGRKQDAGGAARDRTRIGILSSFCRRWHDQVLDTRLLYWGKPLGVGGLACLFWMCGLFYTRVGIVARRGKH